MENLNQDVYIVGDTHGEWSNLLYHIDNLGLRDCCLLHVGDVGIGFKLPAEQQSDIFVLNNLFGERNIQFKAIFGNHDDQSYFDGSVNLPYFELLPNYSYRNFNGEKFLFVGGGISIDRKYRIRHDATRKDGRFSYWKNETFVLKPELVEEVDVLITHSGPTWIGPFEKSGIDYYCKDDETLWEECVKEREDHNKLIELAKPKKHYLGHFHQSQFVSLNGCDHKLLNILEIVEHR